MGKLGDAKKLQRRAFSITDELVSDLKTKIRLETNIEIHQAPYEADAQLCYLSKTNKLNVVFTTDTDLVIFGLPSILFMNATGTMKLYDRNTVLAKLGLHSIQQLRYAAIISGCDYFPKGVHNIGLPTALKWMEDYGAGKLCIEQIYSKRKLSSNIIKSIQMALNTFLFQVVEDAEGNRVHLRKLDASLHKELEYVGTTKTARKPVKKLVVFKEYSSTPCKESEVQEFKTIEPPRKKFRF